MTELSTSLAPAEAPELSTQLDEGRPTEAQPAKEPVEEKAPKESRLDAIKRAAEDVAKTNPEQAKDAAKDEGDPEPKAEKQPDAKVSEPAKEAAPEKAEAPKQEAPGRRPQIEAPEKFLPRAKELWHNTPHEVRADMQRVISEAEQEAATARETVKEFEAVRPFAEMARQSGTTIDQALGRYVQMEQTLRQNPAVGFRTLMQNMEMNPVQAIGHILSAFNVRPEQLAQHIMAAPNEYTALARPQQPTQQQAPINNEVEALKQQLAAMQQQMVNSRVEADVITPFAQENPRFFELQPMIAQFLKSDMIPASLSPHDRLAAAYDMAVRISPSPVRAKPASDPDDGEDNHSDGRAGNDFGGTKSVRGAPASGVDTSNRRRSKMSRGEAITAAMSELGIA